MAEAQEARVRGVFEQPPHEVGHAGDQIADRRVESHAMAEVAQQIALRFGHAEEHLEFKVARLEAEAFREASATQRVRRLCVPKAAWIVVAMVEEPPDEPLVIRVGLGFLR